MKKRNDISLGIGWADAICGIRGGLGKFRYVASLHCCHFVLLFLVATIGVGWGQDYDESEPEVKGKEVLPERVSEFIVKTRAEKNEEIPFFIRTPKGFDPKDRRSRRLLFLCPYIGQTGINRLNQCGAFLDLADERGWFVMTCTFTHPAEWARARKRSFYYPEGFSGKAVLDAIESVARKVPIDTERILLQGLSAGAQFVHRFAMWAPGRVSAVAINSSSWYDSPGKGCDQVAWMVIIGESESTYDASLRVTQELRDVGAAPLFYPYAGEAHQGGGEAVEKLTLEWLKFQDDRSKGQLGRKKTSLDRPDQRLAMQAKEMPYVGDMQILTYKENTPANVADLPEDGTVFLPSKEVAELWGTYEGEKGE